VIAVAQILLALRAYRRNGALSPPEIAALQRRKLERLVAYARRRSPFFRRRYAGLPETGFALEELPPVTKAEMMAHFDDYCTDRRLRAEPLRAFVLDPANVGKKYLGHVAVHTSGTGGEPALIAYDARAFAHVKAVALARDRGLDLRGPGAVLRALRRRARVAVVLMDGGLYPSYSNFIHLPRWHRRFVDVRVLSVRASTGDLVRELNEFAPDGVIGYPSTLAALATEQLAGRLRILRNGDPGGIVTLSEPLLPTTRELLTRAFEVRVDDFYATGECMYIARSCGAGPALHVAADMALLEVVDDRGRPVPPGTFGAKVLLTNLENFVQPFIRYELRDLVAWEREPCACGSPFPRLTSVSGRTDDVLRLRAADGSCAEVHPYFAMVALLARHDILDYQVRQISNDRIDVAVVPRASQALSVTEIEDALRVSLRDARVDERLVIRVHVVPSLAPDPATGKARRVWGLEAST
jgi:phenylacetate-coenzyme A ligase PaaK-like adenylate-forming protein